MMLKLVRSMSLLCVVFALSTSLPAGEDCKDGTACKDCPACEDCKDCPIAKAMDKLPKLVYKIGDETTDSPVLAGRLARQKEATIKFAVTDKVFDVEADAYAALVETTEKFVEDFAKPRKCEVSGNTKVAGKEVCCDVAAGELAALVKKAMDDVKVTYLVGKESVCCPDAAKALAAKTGEKIVQCVGDQKSGCGSSNRLNLARAKYKAAIAAIVAAEKKNTEQSDS